MNLRSDIRNRVAAVPVLGRSSGKRLVAFLGPDPVPLHGVLGFGLITLAWPASWLQAGALGEYSFFPLWLGYILTIDAVVLRRRGSSLLVRNPKVFFGMFLASVPLWWAFEGLNQFTENWQYVGGEHYSTLRYALVASWHFSVVVPAVMETAELIGSFGFIERFRLGPVAPASQKWLFGSIILGIICLGALVLWPRYAFFTAWLSLFLIFDPINDLRGGPSVIGWLKRGDWRLVVSLALGALVCGWFWEMWNFWATPKWEYSISYFEFAHVFEMPLLGYAGYLPFGLETFAGYHFMAGLLGRRGHADIQISGPPPELAAMPLATETSQAD